MAIKNDNDRFVRCIDCIHGSFMQWFENPIIAQCDVFKERMVAQSRRLCKDYVPSGKSNPEVTHFDHYED
ncbi:MAG: hypothetical protein J5486_05565 [Bacteroidaceae bacterium]|nr:hypothetical protein [Bacteroidaceae bacterium]